MTFRPTVLALAVPFLSVALVGCQPPLEEKGKPEGAGGATTPSPSPADTPATSPATTTTPAPTDAKPADATPAPTPSADAPKDAAPAPVEPKKEETPKA